jgi:Methyltransferase small domain
VSLNVLREHLEYLSAQGRLDLFSEAISKIVKEGDVVTDIGCGTGVLGAICLEAGASQSYEVDNSDAIELARETFGRLGFSSRASFHWTSSYNFSPKNLADVCICDHIGYFGFDYDLISVLADARHRYLKPGGRIMPQRLELLLAAVESEEGHKQANAWRKTEIPERFRWLRALAIHCKFPLDLQAENVVTPAQSLAILDLRIDQPEFFSWSVSLRATREATIHGIAGWFNCELADDVWMTNSPLSEKSIKRSQAFLPIDRAVRVQENEPIEVTLMVRPNEELIAWTVRFPLQDLVFKHSTWQGELLGADRLQRSLPSHVPKLTETARAKQIILGYCDGKRTLEEIRALLRNKHPDLFLNERALESSLARALAGSTQ